MAAHRGLQASCILLVIFATLSEACYREIAASLKKTKPKIEYKGCYPSEQMETVHSPRKKAMVRLQSKDCNEECKRTHKPNGGFIGLGRGHCWCGYKGIGDLAANYNCDVDCPGNVREACGSTNFVSVYTMI
ncbi:hypothetical protein BOX15_Mlig009942g2 [Macrostomum lignano]|uniref:WSC domain-containing protein n=1 Tax=Macrostomum lignano TaxID=282301 RepID=A0A267GYZ7_9PLAT|nr:hypothetical protein BOX15_Mlig009942g1 [Macrostomum lignano]PAA91225.1 hypothetical protein BOX15_Mlig009942g2 [Macrostomum lignano]